MQSRKHCYRHPLGLVIGLGRDVIRTPRQLRFLPAPGAGVFATTHWSVVLAAGHSSAPGAQEALETLCRTYWYPLYVYVRGQGQSPHDAQDLTQEFFARLLEKKYLRLADPDRGKFRAFLLKSLKHFLVNEWEKARTQKRGGGQCCHSAGRRHSGKPLRRGTSSGADPGPGLRETLGGHADRSRARPFAREL